MDKKKKKQAKPKRQTMMARVKKAHLQQADENGSYAFQMVGAFFCDFFYYLLQVLKWGALSGLILTAIISIVLFVKYGDTYQAYAKEADQIVADSKAEDFRMEEITYIYAADGTQIAELSGSSGKSSYLKYEDIPADAVNAFVAIEDRSFWRNIGIDVKGIIRVVKDYITSNGDSMAGASTITQQLSRTIYLTRNRSIERKIKEMMVAIRLTRKYSKQEIMEYYINTACFSNGIYGLEAAAKAFFGKSASELTVSQTAYLCAIPNWPEYYNPYKYPKHAVKRRDKILKDMYEEGYLNKGEYEEAVNEKIKIQKAASEFYNYETTYAVSCAVEYLMKLHGYEFRYEFSSEEDYQSYLSAYESAYNLEKTNLYAKGYKIKTSLQTDTQGALQQALDNNLAFATDTDPQSGVFELQGAVTAIDNATGKVIAAVGGRSQEDLDNVYSLNRAYQSYRQPGSSIKPLAVYTPALMSGYTPDTTVYDINVDVAKQPGANVAAMRGTAMSLRYAVEQSKNGVAYSVFNKITPEYGLACLTNMKFDKIVPSDYTLSASLGGLTYGVTTVQMASGYSTLVNGGQYRSPSCIVSLKDSDGNELYKEEKPQTIYGADAADAMLDILKGVLTRGTAKDLKWSEESEIPAAGKTGTTNDSKDGWFCGVTPYYTVSVWIGYDTPRQLESLYGASYPASVWKDAMLYLTDGMKPVDF